MRSARFIAMPALLAVGLWISACSNPGGQFAVIPGGQNQSAARLLGPDSGKTGTATFAIVVPPHPSSSAAPAYVSPATGGVGIVATQGKVSKKFFFPLNTTHCTGGTASTALTCKLSLAVPPGKTTFTVSGYAGATKSTPLLSTATVVATIKGGKTTALKFSMSGVVAFLQIALDDPYPSTGAGAVIPVRVTAADAWGYLIIGSYAKPITLSDSDRTGNSKLSSTSLANSTQAGVLTLKYNGKALKGAAIIKASIGSAKTPIPASASFSPGASGIVATPSFAITSSGVTAATVALSGRGTVAPYHLSTEQDAAHDAACGGFVTVTDLGSDFAVIANGDLGVCWLSASDSAGHTGSVPVLVSAFDWGYTPGTATPPPLPTAPPFSSAVAAIIPSETTPAPGTTSTPVPIPVPSVGKVSGTVGLRFASSPPPGTSVVSVLTNTAPSTVSPLLRKRWGGLHPNDTSALSVILYLELAFGANISLSNQPAISFTLPSDYIVTGANYWVALYDPTQPTRGWQLGFEGPGTVNGSTITFTGNGSAFYFAQNQSYYFALYAQSAAAATPTPPPPPPSPSPTPTPGTTPSPTPTPAFTLSTSDIQFTALGQTAQLSVTGGTPPYFVSSSNSSIATVSPASGNGPFTVTSVAAGTATILITDSLANNASASATVTTVVVPVQ